VSQTISAHAFSKADLIFFHASQNFGNEDIQLAKIAQ
jgi:hypothetical protein